MSRLLAVRSMAASLLAATLFSAAPAAGQFPAELAGRVLDAETGEPVQAVEVEAPGAQRSTLTDAAGAFIVRGLEPGRVTVRFHRIGYASAQADAVLENGRRARLLVRLRRVPVELESLVVAAERTGAGDVRIERAAIEASGARTLADVLESVPGLVVSDGGGARTVSIRGGEADQVLLLLDGVPANDPVTGVAELERVPARAISEVRVLRGARSAAHGAGAMAGAILVETRAAGPPWQAGSAAGTLGELAAHVSGAFAPGADSRLRVGGTLRDTDGEFRYVLPPALGGGSAERRNTDVRAATASAALDVEAQGGRLEARLFGDLLERGLPGPAHAPSPAARHGARRLNGSVAWRSGAEDTRASATVFGSIQRARFRDPAPPIGAPYDDRTRAWQLGSSARLRRSDGDVLRHWGVTADARVLRVRSSTLERDADRFQAGLAGSAAVRLLERPEITLAPTLRLDRVDGTFFVTHDATVSAALGPARLHVAHRSSVSPPNPADQHFREGLAVRANPDLRAERVPSELEVGASVAGELASLPVGAGVTAYRGATRDLIVWAPDHRFVWSPRNRDVRRSGAEFWTRLEPLRGLELHAWYAYARTTYDWPGQADTVQLIYRPRHTLRAAARYSRKQWHFGLSALRTGTRYPVPAKVNALDPFWELDLDAARTLRLGGTELTLRLAVDRLLDATDPFIHGYPEPGRRVRLEIEAAGPWPDL